MRKVIPLLLLLVLGGLLVWLAVQPAAEAPGGLGDEPAGGALGQAEGAQPLDPTVAGANGSAGQGTAPGTAPGAAVDEGARKWIRIVDAAGGGRALAGAELYVGWAPEGRPALGEHQRMAVADGEGRIPFGRSVLLRWYASSRFQSRGQRRVLQLLAVVPGYGTSDWTDVPAIDDVPEETTLTVVAGSALFGEVRDAASGRTIPQARLQVEVGEGRVWRGWSEPFTADGAGAYRVAGLPPQRALRVVVLPSVHAEPLRGLPDPREYPGGNLQDGTAVVVSAAGGEARLDPQAFGHAGVRGLFTVAVEGGEPLPKSVTLTHGYRFERPNPGARYGGTITRSSGTERATITYRLRVITTQREYDRPVTLDPAAPQIELFLPAGENHVVVRTDTLSSEHWQGTIRSGGPEVRATLLLRRRPAVAIQLVDAGGEPLPRAGVEVALAHYRIQPNGTEAGRLLDFVTTDAQGRADVSVLIPVFAERAAGFTEALGLQPMGDRVFRPPGTGSRFDARLLSAAEVRALGGRARAGEPAVITVPATPSRPVTLRVVDPLGRPLSGVEVAATPRSRFRAATARTDTDGLATLHYLGEPHGDDLTDDDGRPAVNTLGVKIGADHWDTAVASVVHGDLAGRLEILDALEHRPLTAGEQRSYAAELAEEAAEARTAAGTDARAAAQAERAIQRAQRELEAQSDPVPRLTLTGTRLLTLECVDGDGAAWRDVTVQIETDAEVAASDPSAARALDADGRVTVRVPLEATVLWVRGEDAERNALFPAATALDPDRTRYRLVLHRQERLEIVVRWPAGAEGATLLGQLTFHIRDAATDDPIGSTRPSGGAAETPGVIWLPSRRVILEAQTPDSSYRGRAEVDVPAGGRVVIDMQRAAAAVDVRVLVVDAIGKPATGTVRAQARSSDEQPYAFEGELDAAGGFTLPLVPGAYRTLVVEADGAIGFAGAFEVPGSGPITITLRKR